MGKITAGDPKKLWKITAGWSEKLTPDRHPATNFSNGIVLTQKLMPLSGTDHRLLIPKQGSPNDRLLKFKNTDYTEPVLLRQGEPGMPQYNS